MYHPSSRSFGMRCCCGYKEKNTFSESLTSSVRGQHHQVCNGADVHTVRIVFHFDGSLNFLPKGLPVAIRSIECCPFVGSIYIYRKVTIHINRTDTSRERKESAEPVYITVYIVYADSRGQIGNILRCIKLLLVH